MLIQTGRKVANIFKLNLYSFILLSLCISQLPWSRDISYPSSDLFAHVNYAQASDADAWYDADWSYRKEITIAHALVTGESLSDYPFLFSATNDDFRVIAEGGDVGQSDGGDMLFTLGDGTTKLSHELDHYDSTSGQVVAWVKIPVLSNSEDTKLYIYYGNVAASDQQDANNVWDEDYRMVQHLEESPANGIAGGHADSTANEMDGTADRFYGIGTTDGQGKIGGADVFKDSVYAPYYWNDPVNYFSRINLPSSLLGSQESFTLSSWMKPNAAGAVLSNNGGEADYCTMSGYAYYAFYLQRVAFNTINNASSTYTGNAYTDFTNISTTVQAGQTYTLTTTNAPYMHHAIKVWFDYNQDGDFTDDGEELLVTAESSYQIGHSISVTIPTTALNGATRMRVRARYNGYNWGGGDRPHPCGYDDYSEAEDYTVIIAGSAYEKADNTFTLGSFDTGKFSIIKNNVTYDAVGDANLNDGLWHYLTAAYGAEGMKLYVDGVLKGTNGSLTGSLDPLRSGFWIGRYFDDRNGRYGFDGAIDEVRVSTSERNANWIRTEYDNQNAPGSFFSLEESEARVMDHFILTAEKAEVFTDSPLTLTIRAINNMGETFTPYSGEKTMILSGAGTAGSDSPTATDKDGNEISFGEDTVLDFENGVASTTLYLYKAETAHIQTSDGSFAAAAALPMVVKSPSATFVAPAKPSMKEVVIRYEGGAIDFRNLPEGIGQIAVSATEDFGSASWEDMKDKDSLLSRFGAGEKIYIKFRTDQGAVSDVIAYTPETVVLQDVRDGDIIRCQNSADPFAVYIVKITNGKKYIRHIVSLDIFNHYPHLKWENVKQVDSLSEYSISGWVRVNTGANGAAGAGDKVWEINGDQTRHWIDMTAEEFLMHGGSEDAIYPINQGEVDLYEEGLAVKLM